MRRIIIAILLCTFYFFSNATEAPKYIFYFIGDGMGLGHVASTDTYLKSEQGDSASLLMLKFPISTICSTFSANSPVTDSAAAGTALATGSKTKNYMLGMNPDSIPVESIAKFFHDKGYGIGLITNVCPDDATPGAFYSHVPNRNMFYEIGCQAAESDYEFIAGSRWRGADGTDLMELMNQKGIQTLYGLDNINKIDSRRVVVLNTDTINNNSGYTIDNYNNSFDLSKLTNQCIKHLNEYTPDKFFIMIEGGNIDWGGHANDGVTVIKEIINFNKAIFEAYDFYLKHPDETLIIVTADHETGGMTLGNNATGYNAFMNYARYVNMSKDKFSEYCKDLLSSNLDYSWTEMKDFLNKNMGFWNYIPISSEDEKLLIDSFQITFNNHESMEDETLYNTYNDFAVNVFAIIDKKCGFGWTSKAHTGNPVGLYCVGKEADKFKTVRDNTEIPILIKELAVID